MQKSEDSFLFKLALQIFGEVPMHAIRQRSIADQLLSHQRSVAYRSPIGRQSVDATGQRHEND